MRVIQLSQPTIRRANQHKFRTFFPGVEQPVGCLPAVRNHVIAPTGEQD